MPRYRKKPIVIEARYFYTEEQTSGMSMWFDFTGDLLKWCGGQLVAPDTPGAGIRITTLEGAMIANPGDWIIKGVKGEFYPCRADIFAATYEAVN